MRLTNVFVSLDWWNHCAAWLRPSSECVSLFTFSRVLGAVSSVRDSSIPNALIVLDFSCAKFTCQHSFAASLRKQPCTHAMIAANPPHTAPGIRPIHTACCGCLPVSNVGSSVCPPYQNCIPEDIYILSAKFFVWFVLLTASIAVFQGLWKVRRNSLNVVTMRIYLTIHLSLNIYYTSCRPIQGMNPWIC